MTYTTIDAETLANLMNGLYTCYWCGGTADLEHISAHVDNCLRVIRWLNTHVTVFN